MQLNTYVDVIRGLESGRTLERIDDHMLELLQRIQATGKKGSLTVTLEIEPQKNSEILMIQPAIKSKPPTIDPSATPAYLTDDAHLSLRNPRQPDIFDRPKGVDDEDPPLQTDEETAAG